MTRFCLFLLSASLMSTSARAETLARYSYTEPHMGTNFQIILYAANEEKAHQAAQAAFARIAALDAIMSDYRPASELMQLCRKAGGEPVQVSAELFFVLQKAQEVSRLSDGAFDVTVRPVVHLWRLARRTQRLPDPEALAKARALVGYQNVKLDAKARTVQLLKPGMQLDLGGIAKGYSADEAHKVLKKHGITRALVAAGGDITVSDAPPPPVSPPGQRGGIQGGGWDIAIYPLHPEENKPVPHLLLKNGSVSTSGDGQQYVEIDGKRYSHIVDPKTGIGLIGRMSVTVVAPNGITADSMTKVVCVLGPEKGMKIIEGVEGVSARMVRILDKDPETFTSRRFPRLEMKAP